MHLRNTSAANAIFVYTFKLSEPDLLLYNILDLAIRHGRSRVHELGHGQHQVAGEERRGGSNELALARTTERAKRVSERNGERASE